MAGVVLEKFVEKMEHELELEGWPGCEWVRRSRKNMQGLGGEVSGDMEAGRFKAHGPA